MKKVIVILAAAMMVMTASAEILLRTAKWTNFGHHYGGYNWNTMSGMLDAASGNSIMTVNDLSDAPQVSSADSLWIDIGPIGDDPGLLTASEIQNIRNFLETGKRVVIMGENDSWTSWNTQITELVYGGYSTVNTDGYATPVLSHELTAGIDGITIPVGGTHTGGSTTSGGTALFSQEVASLFGPSQNALVILDVNIFDDGYNNTFDNGVFAQNVANWVVIPEPASIGLLGLVSGGVYFVRRFFIA